MTRNELSSVRKWNIRNIEKVILLYLGDNVFDPFALFTVLASLSFRRCLLYKLLASEANLRLVTSTQGLLVCPHHCII